MLCLIGFKLYSRWVPLLLRLCLMRVIMHRKRRILEQKLRVSKSENDYLQYTERCRLVNEMVKTAKKTYFTTIIEISKGDQRSLFQSIDHLLNRKAVPRFPLSSSDLELAESFKNFTSQIKLSP